MRASIVLCDYATQDPITGKVHMMGAGWSVTSPSPGARAVAVFIKVGWTESNQPRKFTLRLVSADGQVVKAEGPAGPQPVEFQGSLEVGRPPGIPAGSEIDASFAVNLGSLPLVPGQRFTWRIEMDGEELSAESFYVQPMPQLPAGSADG